MDAPVNANIIVLCFPVNPAGSGMEVKNNIFYNLGANSNAAAIRVDDSIGFDSNTYSFANNIYYHPTGMNISFRGTIYTPAQFITAHDSTGSASAPTFVSYSEYASGNDFRLAAGDTVARSHGAELSSLCSAIAQLCFDKNGVSRPQGSAWDIGAYEYVPAGDTTPPSAPSGLMVN